MYLWFADYINLAMNEENQWFWPDLLLFYKLYIEIKVPNSATLALSLKIKSDTYVFKLVCICGFADYID